MRRIKVFAPIIATALLNVGCGSTSIIMVGQARERIAPNEVQMYATPPPNYREIAILEAGSNNSWAFTEQDRINLVVQRLKESAAQVGANGIIFGGSGDQYTGSIGGASVSASHGRAFGMGASMPLSIKKGQGLAIYVPPTPRPQLPGQPLFPE